MFGLALSIKIVANYCYSLGYYHHARDLYLFGRGDVQDKLKKKRVIPSYKMYMTSTESTCISDMPRRLRGGEEEETKVNYAKMKDLIKTLTEMPKEDEEKIESWKEDNFRKKQEEKTEEEKRVESLSPEEYEKNVENEWLRDLEIDFVVCNNFFYLFIFSCFIE